MSKKRDLLDDHPLLATPGLLLGSVHGAGRGHTTAHDVSGRISGGCYHNGHPDNACVQGADGFRRCASPAAWGWSGGAGDGEG